MHYLPSIAHDDAFAPTERLVTEIRDWVAAMEARGVRVRGNPLRPASEAVTVRVREGEARRKHGPFSRSRQQMCAYELIQCVGLDLAAEVAARHPMAAALIARMPLGSSAAASAGSVTSSTAPDGVRTTVGDLSGRSGSVNAGR